MYFLIYRISCKNALKGHMWIISEFRQSFKKIHLKFMPKIINKNKYLLKQCFYNFVKAD